MVWMYSQSTGKLTRNGHVIGVGYSGSPVGRNKPRWEMVSDVGPIPRGRYRIGNPSNSYNHGPHVMALMPVGHTAFGRTHFLIHGERQFGPPGRASQGCIILAPNVRHQISASGDHELIVVE